jgi:hypothetical protein
MDAETMSSWLAGRDWLTWIGFIILLIGAGVLVCAVWRVWAYERAKTTAVILLRNRPRDGHYDWEHLNAREQEHTLAVERKLQRALERIAGQNSPYDQWYEGRKERFGMEEERKTIVASTHMTKAMKDSVEAVNELLGQKSIRENMPLAHERDRETLKAETEEAKTRGWEAKQRRARKRPASTPESQEKKSATDTFMGDLDDDED